MEETTALSWTTSRDLQQQQQTMSDSSYDNNNMLNDMHLEETMRIIDASDPDDVEFVLSDSEPMSPATIMALSQELHAIHPELGKPEEVLPLGQQPGVELLPHDRPLHRYDPDLYPVSSRLRQDWIDPYELLLQPNIRTSEAAVEVDTKKRKSNTSDDTRASKAPRPAPAPRDESSRTTRSTKVQTSSNASQPASLQSAPLHQLPTTNPPSLAAKQQPRVTSSAPQHAPQAPRATSNLTPPPAPVQQMVIPPQSIARRMNGKSTTYGELMRDRPPVNVCLPLDLELGIVELLTFFPNSVQIPMMAKRLMRNRMPAQTVAKMQLDPVNELNEKNTSRVEDKVKWQFKHAGELEYAHKIEPGKRSMWSNIAKADGDHRDLTANHFKLRSEYPEREETHVWGHYKLKYVYEQIDSAKWPQGNDRMVLTQCLEFARDNSELDLDTSHWDWIIQRIDAHPPPFPAGGYATRDHEAIERFAAIYPTKLAQRNARR